MQVGKAIPIQVGDRSAEMITFGDLLSLEDLGDFGKDVLITSGTEVDEFGAGDGLLNNELHRL